MAQSGLFGLAPVVTCGARGHDIDVAMVQRDHDMLTHRFGSLIPLEHQVRTIAQTETNHSLPLSIAMIPDPALGQIVVVVAFCVQLVCIGGGTVLVCDASGSDSANRSKGLRDLSGGHNQAPVLDLRSIGCTAPSC